jgi:hypothetical protein
LTSSGSGLVVRSDACTVPFLPLWVLFGGVDDDPAAAVVVVVVFALDTDAGAADPPPDPRADVEGEDGRNPWVVLARSGDGRYNGGVWGCMVGDWAAVLTVGVGGWLVGGGCVGGLLR